MSEKFVEKQNSFHAKTRKQWRNWLIKNHEKTDSVWLIMYKKDCEIESVNYPEAVEEALCFGWIDSLANKRDELSHYQFYSRRKPKSNWSASNKIRVAKLIEQGLMMPAGMAMVELAKKSGTWTKLEEVDNLTVPDDLLKKFSKDKLAFANWTKFSPSSKRLILQWILSAKKEETRTKRILNTVELAARNEKANH